MINAFLYLTIAFVGINIMATIFIVYELQRRNIIVDMLLIRLLIFRYLRQYKEITVEESGSPGLLYYLWLVSINLAALSAFGLVCAQLKWI